MIRTLFARRSGALQQGLFSVAPQRSLPSFSPLRKNSDLSEGERLRRRRNVKAEFDLDELLANSPKLTDSPAFSFGKSSASRANAPRDPREVAKSIPVSGPAAGRSLDVIQKSLGAAIGNMYRTIRTSNIRGTVMTQARFIRPAKYRKAKKSRWWKKHFALRFAEMMGDIKDAQRRGY